VSSSLLFLCFYLGNGKEAEIIDANTAYTGNLMLAIQARTFNTYFYISNANTSIHPPLFRHKVAGILFENKVDYTS
jgi:endo-1,3(4)-beta-glucanase